MTQKKDAAVYKALAELGIDFKYTPPAPEEDTLVDRIIHPEDTYLDTVEDLFTNKPKK